MSELLSQYWWLLVFALLLGIVVAWWVFAVNDKTRIKATRSQDVLDEGAARAQRNQALIDSPPAAARTAVEPSAPQAAVVAEPVNVAPAHGGVDDANTAPGGDDLSRIKGVGPKLVALLSSLGVTSFDQIASWSEADIDRIDAQLGNFAGRIRRDNWQEQARLLAAGDTGAYEAKFGKI